MAKPQVTTPDSPTAADARRPTMVEVRTRTGAEGVAHALIEAGLLGVRVCPAPQTHSRP